jgi:cytochrome c peroxidase
MYAALIPALVYGDFFNKDGEKITAWRGGLFHDGRARDTFEQVQQPFFNPDEMNLPDSAALAAAIRKSSYADSFRQWIGNSAWNDDSVLLYQSYRALVEFLKDPLFRPFDARIDDYLNGDQTALNESEKRGFGTFTGSGRCSDCHLLTSSGWGKPLLSDFGYANLGVPLRGEKDPGLGARTGNPEELGQFRAPSLRNIQLTAPYMHNGSIATLREVIEFYNKRDIEPDRWGPTDYPDTVDRVSAGNLRLTDQDVSDLLAFMSSFTDRSLLNLKPGTQFPVPPAGVPSTQEKRPRFPDWTHRLHPAYPGESKDPE